MARSVQSVKIYFLLGKTISNFYYDLPERLKSLSVLDSSQD